MFMTTAKHESIVSKKDSEILILTIRLNHLLTKWNSLVETINLRGGDQFLYGNDGSQFDDDEIKKLLMLCHPDKHNGKDMAKEITQKLLAIKSNKH